MSICPEALRLPHSDSRPSAARRSSEKMVSIAALICCVLIGPTGCTTAFGPVQSSSGSLGPTGAQITAAAIGVGAVAVTTVVLIHVHHSHHTLKGCVSSGQNGLQVQAQGDPQTFALAGNTADIKDGDLVRFHGKKEKKVKGSSGNRTFTVERISRDYGPCKVNSAPPAVALNAR